MATLSETVANKTFSQIESQAAMMYREAKKDIASKINDFTRHHRAKDKEMQRGLKKGTVTQAQYQSWIKGQVFIGNQWRAKKDSINATIAHVMNEASAIVHDKSKEVFTENANYAAYEIEKDYGGAINFNLYDKTTVDMLLRDDPELLIRRTDADGNKLEAWNTKTIDNAISQGIIQGESINKISDRIARDLCIKANRSTLMYARTAMTCAQNAGRVERMKDAEEAGIKILKVWISTMDERTRSAHQQLDGQEVPVDQPFSSELGPIYYPGDPNADEANVWNCRCALGYNYPEHKNRDIERTAYYEEGDPEYDPDHRNYEKVKNMTYEQWVNYKQNQIRVRYGGSPITHVEPVKPVVDLRETRITDIMSSHTVDQMTPEQRQEFTEVLGNMTDDMLELYTHMVKFHENNNYTDGPGWYSPFGKKVEMTLKANKWEKTVGRSESTGAWKTKFHEELHQLDHILSITWNNRPYGSATACEANWFGDNMGKRMKDAIHKDILGFFNRAIDKYVEDAHMTNPQFKLKHVDDLDKPIQRDVRYAVMNMLADTTHGTGNPEKAKAMLSAFTDAIGLATGDRISPYNEGYWGHNSSYNKSQKNNGATSECFAEIGSHIMRNDKEALEFLSGYMPASIEEYKRSLGEILEYARSNDLHY